MRAVVCLTYGPIDQLAIEERLPSPCGLGQVRVAISAAGVNFVDSLLIQGLYQVKPPLPYVPGGEACGIVAEVGEGVTGHRVGDRVFVMCGFGAMADEVVVREQQVLAAPPSLSDGQIATFFQSYMTAWFALRERARATAGQWLLVLGAGSGVGLAAVDVGRALGLRVIAGASSAEKRDAALAMGAEAVIDTMTENVKERARELSGGGVDLTYDPVGGDLAEQGLRAIRPGGQFLVIGFASGTIPRLPANLVLLQNRNITGVDWGGWVGANQARNAELVAEVYAAIAEGRLHPVEPTTYPLLRAAEAILALAERRVTGKVAVCP